MKPQRGLGRSMVTFYSLFTPMKDDGCSRHRLRKHLDSMRVANRSNIALSLYIYELSPMRWDGCPLWVF